MYKVNGTAMKINIDNIDGQNIAMSAPKPDILDICKMISLSSHVDASILNVEDKKQSILLQQFQIFSGDPKDNISFKLTLDDLRDLSQILEGVNVVDADDFFGEGACNIPDDDRMQELTENVTELYEKIFPTSFNLN
ncbi:MAG: hypothetical protein L3J22_10495 [Xanthomonadales bacterium]|nr:hypothetical protein [Xanthomonadales bacterium]